MTELGSSLPAGRLVLAGELRGRPARRGNSRLGLPPTRARPPAATKKKTKTQPLGDEDLNMGGRRTGNNHFLSLVAGKEVEPRSAALQRATLRAVWLAVGLRPTTSRDCVRLVFALATGSRSFLRSRSPDSSARKLAPALARCGP